VGDYSTVGDRPRRRTGRRLLVGLLVLLVLLFIALVVVDRVGANYAEREIADRVAAQIRDRGATASPPDVDVAGVPFLTQVAEGRYEKIGIVVRDLTGTREGKTVRMPLVDITAGDVRAPVKTLMNGGEIVAGTVGGQATLEYASVAALIGREGVVLAERNGKLFVTAPLQALGRTFQVNGTADVTVQGSTVRIKFQELTAEGLAAVPLAQNLVSAYASQISIDMQLPPLPLNLQLQTVTPKPEGLVLTAQATEVPLNTTA
jgi:hypothetical protein